MPALERRASEAGTQALKTYYLRLLTELGPQGWWPGRTRLEIILGAILTQNTAWNNAALALKRLRKAALLGLPRLLRATQSELESAIQPAGFYRQKARAIRGFLEWLVENHGGSLRSLFSERPEQLREQLLELWGLGPETVDAILLYAGRIPLFVADNYTRRILARHELIPSGTDYSKTQRFLHRCLPADHFLFNEFHALLVEAGKRYCKRQAPKCEDCPLREYLPRGQARGSTQPEVRLDSLSEVRGAQQ